MSKKEEILKKLKAIADDTRGNDNEREVAQKRLDELMQKYNITLDSIEMELQHRRDFYFKNDWEKRLIFQTIYKVCGDIPVYKQHGRKNWVWAEMTDAEYLEFELCYPAYKQAFKKELDLFMLGFISKNNIYPTNDKIKNSEDDDKPSKYSRADILRAGMMAEGIETVQIRRQLNDKNK